MYDPPDFVGDMYVLQYPLRPSYRPYGDQGVLDKVELKPKSRRLRFAYKLHQNDHYAEEDVMQEKYEQRHTLNSTVVANPACSYAVGVIRQGRMTLTPIRAVNQLRPDFEDFEKLKKTADRGLGVSGVADGHEGARAARASDSEEEPGPMEPVEAPMAPVRVEYLSGKGAQADAQMAAKAADTEDAWKRLDFFDASSPESADIYLQHIVFAATEAAEADMEGSAPEHPKLQPLELDGDNVSFLKSMCGRAEERNRLRQLRQKASLNQDGLSSYVLSKMPAERQVEAIVRHFGVASYAHHVRKRLPQSTLRSIGSDVALITMLQDCAVLVCGNWVLKSKLANFEGMEANARDLLLSILNKRAGRLLPADVSKWSTVFQQTVAADALREIVRSVLQESEDKQYWKMKAEPDQDFIHRYSELVRESDDWLESRRAEVIKAGKESSGGATGSRLQASAGASSRMRARLLPEAREALLSGPKTTEELKRLIQRKHPTEEIREEDLLGVLSMEELDALQVRGVWVLARTGTESHDKFRKTLLSLFRHRDSVTRQEVMEEYQQIHGERCKLSDYVVRQQLREIAEKVEDGPQTVYIVKGALQTR